MRGFGISSLFTFLCLKERGGKRGALEALQLEGLGERQKRGKPLETSISLFHSSP